VVGGTVDRFHDLSSWLSIPLRSDGPGWKPPTSDLLRDDLDELHRPQGGAQPRLEAELGIHLAGIDRSTDALDEHAPAVAGCRVPAVHLESHSSAPGSGAQLGSLGREEVDPSAPEPVGDRQHHRIAGVVDEGDTPERLVVEEPETRLLSEDLHP